MSALREKIIEFIVKQKDRAKQLMLIGLAVMGLTFAFLTIVPQAFGIPILIFQLLIFASEVLLYKAYSDDTSFNGKRLLKISMVLYITFMVSTPIRALLYKISNKALTGAWLMLTAMGVILPSMLRTSNSAPASGISVFLSFLTTVMLINWLFFISTCVASKSFTSTVIGFSMR